MMPEATTIRPSAKDRIRAALWFAERGFGIFTVWSADARGACRCPAGARCEQAGKHPITAHGFHDATTDPARITTLLSAASEPNYGLVCPEGVFALDVDGDGIAQLAALEQRFGKLPDTLRTQTAHGEHIFLRWPTSLPRPLGQLFGFVTRWGSGRDAGYVIGPRSVHASGKVYAPAGTAFDIAELPEAWARSVVEAKPAPTAIVVTGGYQMPERIGAGGRYDAIRGYVAHLYNKGLSRDEMWPLVRDILAPHFADALGEQELRSRFERTVGKLGERLGPPRGAGQEPQPEHATPPAVDAVDLLGRSLPPLRMIVPDLLPEGTTILAAPPKIGKSCLVYQVVVEVAIGGELLGRRVEPGSCLYLALEDGERRGQDRLRTALAGRSMPRGRLEIQWSSRHIGRGLEEDLGAWLDEHPDAGVVAIDTLQKVRDHADSRRNAYEVDVEDLGRLQNLFRNRPVALLIVHHLRKESGDDFLSSVSGTYGITGSADSTIVIRRKRLETYGKIVVTGRDVVETEIGACFDDKLWSAAPISLPTASTQRADVFTVIREQGPIFPKAIAEETGLERTNVQHIVERLYDSGAVRKTTKGYVAAGVVLLPDSHSSHSKDPSVTVVTLESDESDGGVSARARARESLSKVTPVTPVTDPASVWARPCREYGTHQTHHRLTPAGWTCDACYPQETTA